MQPSSAPAAAAGSPLAQSDLIACEQFLRDVFSRFLTFKTHSLYFPRAGDDPAAEGFGPDFSLATHLPGERKVLIPLCADGRLLGVFIARGASLGAPRTVLPLLPRIAAMALREASLAKALATDALTGLATGETLLANMAGEIERVQERILPGSGGLADPGLSGPRGGFGLVALDLDFFSRVAAQHGFLAAEATLAAVGRLFARLCPQQGLAARLHDDLFGFFLPGASAARCRETAETFVRELSRLTFPVPATGESFSLTASAGAAAYPQDMRGGQFAAPPAEQAQVLWRKAKKALAVAKDLGRDQAMAWSRILAEGGVVLETLPLSRLAVSLGRFAEAEAGQRFLVWSPKNERPRDIRKSDGERVSGRSPTTIKGEVALLEVGEDMAFAEVLQLADPDMPLEPGDRLLLAPEAGDAAAAVPACDASPRRDKVTGLYDRRDFLRLAAQDREKRQAFSMVLALMPDASRERRSERPAEADMAETVAVCRAHFGQDVLGGRFSSGKIVFYLPGREPESLREAAEACLAALTERLGKAAVGIAGYPFLDFSRADVTDNCRKALDHALLLPEGPKLAVFDSLSLTVSGDRLFAMGDVYAAMEEFKQALLADEGNILARNSLGICLARLGRLEAARAEFTRVIGRDAKNTMALYNLGCVCRRLSEAKAARTAFQKCLRADPQHVFSLLRLGRMAEEDRRFETARKYYRRAMETQNGPALTLRHLARLAFAQGRLEEAREHLHQALLHDPKDAFSLHLMARLYLEEGQDPAIAEAMARQAAALRPDRPEFWRELSRALAAQGKDDAAREALARAEGV